MTNKALITPNVFKWARESARITQETAAAKVSVTIDRLKNWEEGISLPTIKQAKTLAKAYKRPFALFFLPEIPQDFQPLQDFRKSGAKPLSTSSIFIIREIQQKQAWISDFYAENQENKLPFVGRFSVKNKPQQVAQDILTSLKMNPPAYQTNNPIKEWINAAETNGIFISKTSFIQAGLKLDLEELQGFAIADAYAPFVFINSNDWNSSQLFTLVHELAHIWIAQTGLSNQIESELEHKDKFHPVELFCNEVTANVLMPKEFFLKLDSLLFQDFQEIVKIAKQLGVSSYALLVRALNLKVITHTVYQQVKNQLDNNYNTYLQKAKQTQQNKQGKLNIFFMIFYICIFVYGFTLMGSCNPSARRALMPNASAETVTEYVYLCNGAKSKKYHIDPDCKGLTKCTTELEKVKVEEAIERGRTLCGYERK